MTVIFFHHDILVPAGSESFGNDKRPVLATAIQDRPCVC